MDSNNFQQLLINNNACDTAVRWSAEYNDLAAAILKCTRPDWLMWLGKKLGLINSTNLPQLLTQMKAYDGPAEGKHVAYCNMIRPYLTPLPS